MNILDELETNPNITKACERAINAIDTILKEHPYGIIDNYTAVLSTKYL